MSSSQALSEHSGISRRDLVDGGGRTYLEVRAELEPRWGRLWTALVAGHVALVACVVGVGALSGRSIVLDGLLAVAGAAVIGFVVHYLVLFQHEAAHGNLARSRPVNDVICDVVIGPLIGESIAAYRAVHLAHHRHLGTVRDTERSYFEAFGVRFIVEGLSGARVLRVRRARAASVHRGDGPPPTPFPWVLAAALVLHGGMVGGAFLTGYPTVAVAWILGVGAVFPLVNTTRQLLEHRDDHADPTVDYATTDHGAVNRLFGSGPLASTLGGAGFNRHLLHHWDPGVSCTRLADLEHYLEGTPLAGAVRGRRTTYVATARRLFRA